MQYVFGDCVLDPERRELIRGSLAIAVGPQVFDLLLHLVQNREHVVGKDGLLDAVWAGRIVSKSTLTSHINAARKAIGDSGHDQRLIRTIARKGFRFVGDVREASSAASTAAPTVAPLASPDKPSIAVLPFVNLSGDPEQEYIADGVVEDVIGALSRFGWLFVIARNSSFTYKGRAVDIKQIGQELGVRYVLEGSVRRSDKRVRITGQLIDAGTGAHIWADRFEGPPGDIFELQDQIAESVVGAIAPQLERAEIERARRKPTDSLDAYDHYLRGLASFQRGTREGTSAALLSFYSAIERDPDFASAYGMAAASLLWQRFNGWASNSAATVVEGERLARAAVALGRDDAVALARGGHALANFVGDIDGGIALIDQALKLNPNMSAGWFLGGFVRILRGESDEAVERLAHAMRLSPLDAEMHRMCSGIALAHLYAHHFDEAALWAEKALRQLPTFFLAAILLTASLALAGRDGDARQAFHRLRELDPAFRVARLDTMLPNHQAENIATIAEGLRRAGLRE